MTNKQYTSLSLSKKLKEGGCELESDFCIDEHQSGLGKGSGEVYKVYDILWDILKKYAKQFFGEKTIKANFGNENIGDRIVEFKAYQYHSKHILDMLQEDKPQQDIEKYIEENCLFIRK